MKSLDEKELKELQEVNKEFGSAKIALADSAYQQANIIKALDELRSKFSVLEKELTEKYGSDVSINLESGEITDNPEEPAKNAE